VLRTKSRPSFVLRAPLIWWMLHASWAPSSHSQRGEGDVGELQAGSRRRDFPGGGKDKENQELNVPGLERGVTLSPIRTRGPFGSGFDNIVGLAKILSKFAIG
jgi:hypothetical protein